jgi:flavodoxin I
MAKILFIYGTTGGNTEMVVEQVAELLKRQRHKVTLKRVEHSKPADMKRCDVAVLASPTYGHGILQDDMIPFEAALKKMDLKGQKCAVIGLGDPKYDAQYHIESAPILEKAVKEAGGELLLPALRVTRSPVLHLKGLIPMWTKQLLKAL